MRAEKGFSAQHGFAKTLLQSSGTPAREQWCPYTTTSTVTRQVFGASVGSYLNIENVGDVAFSVSDLEISAMLPGRTRDRFVPIATMLPSGQLITGIEPVYNLAPFEQKGPIIISNREIYPNLVEDLMRNPRGLIFEVANYDITDEFGRHMAYQQEEVLGRTITLTIDPGDGTFQRYAVATNGAYGGRCEEGSVNAGAICRNDADCLGGACEPVFFGGFDDHGTPIALPLDFVMRDVLGLQKNPSQPDAIVAGVNGRVDTVAVDDDIQVVPIGTTGLNDRTIVVLAGEDGVLDTVENNVSGSFGDDVPANTSGYETSPTCNADTAASINEPETDGDGIASTVAEGDDVQEVTPDTVVSPGHVIVSAGLNGILETVVDGDDEYRGPGEPCAEDSDCPGGACNGREVLVRFENSKTGDPNRFWIVLTSEEICQDPPAECEAGIPVGSDFGDIPLRPTQAVTLAFGQDIDRDGLFAREEFIYGSSDQKKDTDEDTLDDFAEIRESWEVDVVGRFPEQVYPDPRFKDSDFDGLKDPEEQDCLTDPTKRDTDGDGLFDVIELGITTDFNGNGEIDDFERGFGRCCQSGGTCAQTPTVPCRDDEDCENVTDFPDCHGFGRCCDEDGDCDPDSSCWGDDECLDPLYPECTDYDLTGVCPPQGVPPEWPERLDPRNPDTDGDSIEDGHELELGLNPLDPYDADAYRDADHDGLYDWEEQAGWEVAVHWCDLPDCAGSDSTETYYPNPLVGDTDFDGLPDYLERQLGTNPQDDDTDCDGILDYDEFAEFRAYMNLSQVYPGFYLSGSGSQQLGTDPTSQDTDGDRLPDTFELYQGWRVLACTDSAPRDLALGNRIPPGPGTGAPSLILS